MVLLVLVLGVAALFLCRALYSAHRRLAAAEGIATAMFQIMLTKQCLDKNEVVLLVSKLESVFPDAEQVR